jgi:ParB/RepB/Spo0J family partition protein
MTTTATSPTNLRQIPIAALQVSLTGPQASRRAHFAKADLGELADSIRQHGVIQPIVVRSLNGGSKFEIVAGERRFLAAKQAELHEIPALIGDWSDEQVLEVQLIENLQRADLHPLQEAEGYEQLMKLHGHHADELGDKVGKSKAYVYARLKLLALCKAAREAFYAGKLTPSTALLIARIPDQDLQNKALKDITTPRKTFDGPGEPMSVREAAKHIQDEYMLRLSSAGFKTEDATLLPVAGACGPCAKRTGNQPELFGDVKGADVCTDLVCFRKKIAAHAERAIAAAKDSGQKVLAGAEAKKVARYGTETHHLEGYVRLDARDYSSTKGTYRQTLGKKYVPTLLQDPDTGKMIEVAPNKDIDKAHGNTNRSSNDRSADRYKAQQRTAEKKHKAEVAYRIALFTAVRAASGKRKALSRCELELVAERMLDRLDHESKKRLFTAVGWEPTKKGHSTNFDPPVPYEKMSDEDLAQLARDCALAHELQVWQHSGDSKPRDLEAAAAALDVDAKKIRRDLDAAKKAKASKKKAAKK